MARPTSAALFMLRVMMLGLGGFPGVQGGVEAHAEHLCPLLRELACDVEWSFALTADRNTTIIFGSTCAELKHPELSIVCSLKQP